MDFNNTDTLETEVTSVHPYLTRNLTARKTTGRLNLGLTIGVTGQINTANLLSGEWRF